MFPPMAKVFVYRSFWSVEMSIFARFLRNKPIQSFVQFTRMKEQFHFPQRLMIYIVQMYIDRPYGQ